MLQKCLALIRCDTFLTVGRHVRWLLGFLTLQYRVEVLFVRQGRIEFLLCLLPVANHTFGFEISCGVRRLCLTLSGCNAQKHEAEKKDSSNRYYYVLDQFHHPSLSIVRSRFLSATTVPCGKTRKTTNVDI